MPGSCFTFQPSRSVPAGLERRILRQIEPPGVGIPAGIRQLARQMGFVQPLRDENDRAFAGFIESAEESLLPYLTVFSSSTGE